ncbi:MAG: hypothetical protein J0L93_11160 [Deltaproteobacteria bacterium]|nr:hypothetical protein [Deltaproteobacteria bacterium]
MPNAISWEFLFLINILFTAIFPLLISRCSTKKSAWIFFGVASALPYFYSGITWLFIKRGDIEFHFALTALHWNLSVFNLFLLWNLLSKPQKILKFYGWLVLSALVSLSALVLSPALAFIDPFWGVVPGTISLDPIISLAPYFLRLWVCFIALLILVRWRKSFVYIFSIWITLGVIGFFAPSSFLSLRALKHQFKSPLVAGPLQIFIQDTKSEKDSSELWSSELLKHFENLKSKLPPSMKPRSDYDFKVFIYRDDDTKYNWIRARQVQVGHFPRGEMHLSHLTPQSEILPHELAHLIHGQSTAPIKSYLDPFYLEGFAVAIASEKLETAIENAAAFAQTLPENKKLIWPKGLAFFKNYPAEASYALAGGFAAYALQRNLAPWEMAELDPQILLTIKVSAEKKKRAQEIFLRPPLLEDPLRRDCARLKHNVDLNPSEKNKTKLERICNLATAAN